MAGSTPREREVRTLVLLRHAKSDYPPGVPDHDRPLAPRGQRDAPAAGGWLAEHWPAIDRVVVSSAVRAQQTWDRVAPLVPRVGAVVTEPRIYEATPAILAGIVSALPSDENTVMIVGHNPGLEDFAAMITASGEGDAMERLSLKYPTSGIAVLQAEGSWPDLLAGGHLVEFVAPRG